MESSGVPNLASDAKVIGALVLARSEVLGVLTMAQVDGVLMSEKSARVAEEDLSDVKEKRGDDGLSGILRDPTCFCEVAHLSMCGVHQEVSSHLIVPMCLSTQERPLLKDSTCSIFELLSIERCALDTQHVTHADFSSVVTQKPLQLGLVDKLRSHGKGM